MLTILLKSLVIGALAGAGVLVNTNENQTVRGTFNMNSGEISDNTAIYQGGGVEVAYATMNLAAGTITGNKCGNNYFGGGVFSMTSPDHIEVEDDFEIDTNNRVESDNEDVITQE